MSTKSEVAITPNNKIISQIGNLIELTLRRTSFEAISDTSNELHLDNRVGVYNRNEVSSKAIRKQIIQQ